MIFVDFLLAGCSSLFHSYPLLGWWTRDDERACVNSVVRNRSRREHSRKCFSRGVSDMSDILIGVVLAWSCICLNTPPCVVFQQQSTTAAVLLYRFIYMVIWWVDGLVGGLWTLARGCVESVARLAASVRTRAKSSRWELLLLWLAEHVSDNVRDFQ